MATINKDHAYYCEMCGVELYNKARLCRDCNADLKMSKTFPKKKNEDSEKPGKKRKKF